MFSCSFLIQTNVWTTVCLRRRSWQVLLTLAFFLTLSKMFVGDNPYRVLPLHVSFAVLTSFQGLGCKGTSKLSFGNNVCFGSLLIVDLLMTTWLIYLGYESIETLLFVCSLQYYRYAYTFWILLLHVFIRSVCECRDELPQSIRRSGRSNLWEIIAHRQPRRARQHRTQRQRAHYGHRSAVSRIS